MDKNYIAFFDLDHTIISVNSARILIKTAYKKGLIARSTILKGYLFSFSHKLKLYDPSKIITSMAGWLSGVPEEGLMKLSEEIFTSQLIHSIRKEITEEIIRHKSLGAKVVILSSSIYPICSQISVHLAMDDIICSNLELINGKYTGRATGPFCYGREKAVRLNEYCEANNTDPAKSWYYGDEIADQYVLNAAGNQVCVNPDKRLLKKALAKGWSVLECE